MRDRPEPHGIDPSSFVIQPTYVHQPRRDNGIYNRGMKCPHYGAQWPTELSGALKYCGACGKPLENTAQMEEVPAVSSVSAPGGKLRFITVLFADLAGFTAFAEDRSPDEVAGIVGDLLQRL